MLRLNILLLAAVVASALFLVHTQYEARRLFTERERAQHDARELMTEYQRLQVEKRAQATPLRVERLARDKLHMRTATPAITHYVTADGKPVAAPLAAPAAAGGRR